MNSIPCPYCNGTATLRTNDVVYGKIYGHGKMYICENFPSCDSYVGCHENGTPLGSIANKPLRVARKKAHSCFDPLWMNKSEFRRFLRRKDAYLYLSEYLDIPYEETHIGFFDEEKCRLVVEFCKHITDTFPHGSRLHKKEKIKKDENHTD